MKPLPTSTLHRSRSIVLEHTGATDALTPFYGVGADKIAIHYAADAATLDGNGKVTALRNKGGASALFNAAITGNPLAIGSGLIRFDRTGVAIAANPIDLTGVHVIYVLELAEFSAPCRIMGSAGSTDIRTNANATTGWNLQGWSNATGAAKTANLTTTRQANIAAKLLVEHRIIGSTQTTWINGGQVGTGAFAVTNGGPFQVDQIGAGYQGLVSGLIGGMNDVLGITIGAGIDVVVGTVRSEIARRNGISL